MTRMGGSAKLAGHQMQNLVYQLNDVVVSLFSGQKPMTVFMQQGSQSRPVVEGLLGYVLPGATMRWPAPTSASTATVLKGRVNGVEPAQTINQGH